MNNQNDLLIKAALLHDVGKICHRANSDRVDHSASGAKFLTDFLAEKDDNERKSAKKILLRAVKYHHGKKLASAKLEKDDFSYIVYEADNIASGSDRRKNAEIEGEDDFKGFDIHANLASVFNLIDKKSSVDYKFPLVMLNAEEKINFPQTGNIEATKANYQKILDVLTSNFKRSDLLTMSVNELLHIIEATSAYVPSSTNTEEVCDISLFDHQKITAAIASSLYAYFKENGIEDYKTHCFGSKQKDLREQKSYSIISGDISGIQDFIYTIPSAGALKSLRGRSFYLEVLVEIIIDEILDELDLSRCNLIYSGGGHFYLMVANTNKTKEKLKEMQEKIDQWFLGEFGTRLYLAIAIADCSANDMLAKDEASTGISGVFRELSKNLGKAKLARYNNKELKQLFDLNSAYNKIQNDERECSICHDSTKELVVYRGKFANEEAGTKALVCKTCEKLYELGNKVVNKSFALIVSKTPGEDAMELLSFGEKTYLYAIGIDAKKMTNGIRKVSQLAGASLERKKLNEKLNKELNSKLNEFQKTKNISKVYVKNSSNVGKDVATNLWVGDYITYDENDDVADFETLATMSGNGQNKGIKRLGVLRADVDSLGANFLAGLYKKDVKYRYATISRYAALSRELSIFFKHYINNICEGQLEGAKENTNCLDQFKLFNDRLPKPTKSKDVSIIYSGGDDMFIVGAWDQLLELAVDLRRAFEKYTCGKLTFSAGLALFHSKFPISQMATIAGKLEDNAKSIDGKNSISLFGESEESMLEHKHTYKWDDFENKVCGEKLRLLEETWDYNGNSDSKGKLVVGKSMMYKLLNLLDPNLNKTKFNLARFAYTLARLEPSPKSSVEMKNHYSKFRDNFYKWAMNNKDKKELITAINLLIYKIRETEKGE